MSDLLNKWLLLNHSSVYLEICFLLRYITNLWIFFFLWDNIATAVVPQKYKQWKIDLCGIFFVIMS